MNEIDKEAVREYKIEKFLIALTVLVVIGGLVMMTLIIKGVWP